MKSTLLLKVLLPGLVMLTFCLPASAAITLYDANQTTFSVDGFFNAHYAFSEEDKTEENVTTSQSQSRVKMGFLPNYIGFNFSKQVDNLKMGGRSSFWVTINDSDTSPVNTGIDIRQFYGTVDADWGQVLIGKDFTLFSRSNIFMDEILIGFGKTGGIDTDGVSFGNIGSGYTYPLPAAQITYRTPVVSDFKLAVGIIDPSRTSGDNGEESAPRFEGELTYNKSFDAGSVTAWAGFLSQSSKNGADGNVDSRGVSYGVNGKFASFSLTASGFTGSGIGKVLGPGFVGTGDLLDAAGNEIDSSGYLVQGAYVLNKFRFVASYGYSELDKTIKEDDETVIGAIFYTINDNFKLSAEYNIQTATTNNKAATSSIDSEIKTFALGAIINF